MINNQFMVADGGSGTSADGVPETSVTPQREYNNLWDWIRYGWEDLVNHPATWGGLAGANAPGSTGDIFDAIQRSETLHDSSAFDSDYSVDLGGQISKILPTLSNVNDAKTYGDLEGQSVEEQLQWLINNDPENSQGWMEQLIGLRAERENVQQARDYDNLKTW